MVIDVSKHEGAIDWRKVKASGVDATIIRCGYGSNMPKYDDPRYHENMRGALAAGLKVGVYLYSYAKTMEKASSEASHALRLIEPYRKEITLPIYYDVEEAGTEKGVKERVKLFCETIEKAGFRAGVYANIDWWRDYLGGVEKYTKWVASWRDSGKPVNKPDISNMGLWQYYAYGTVDGIEGARVDLSEAYGDIKEIIEKDDNKKEGVVEVELHVIRRESEYTEEVKTIQRNLKALGYKGKNKKELAVDGLFQNNTAYAVSRFQSDNGLVDDEIVGVKTWNKLLKERKAKE